MRCLKVRWLKLRGRFRAWLGCCPKCGFDPELMPLCTICGGNWTYAPVPEPIAESWISLYEAEFRLRGL